MVKVSGKPAEEEIDKLRNGIMLPPEPGLTGARGKKQPGVERRSFAILTQPAVIQLAVDQENPWYEVTLTEGRNRQIRRMFEQIGYHIEKIKRVRYGSLTLDLEPGEFRHLTPKEVNQLRKSLDTPFKPKPIKVKRKDERPERKPRIDAARFVKGRRGKPSADAAPAPISRTASASSTRSSAGSGYSATAPRREFTAREDRGERSSFARPRGPEFGQGERRDAGFAAKRPYTRKPAGEFGGKPTGDFKERPKRSYAPKPAGSFDRKPDGVSIARPAVLIASLQAILPAAKADTPNAKAVMPSAKAASMRAEKKRGRHNRRLRIQQVHASLSSSSPASTATWAATRPTTSSASLLPPSAPIPRIAPAIEASPRNQADSPATASIRKAPVSPAASAAQKRRFQAQRQ